MRFAMALALMGFLAACSGEDLTAVQADPVSVTTTGSPNWALAAPREIKTATMPTQEVPIFATGAEELLGYLDTVALADDRVEALDPAWTTTRPARAYVQRSSTFGFPDVISVEAIDLGAGDAGQRASLVIYSQAVYGYSDLGVNRERLERWLSRLSDIAPPVAGRAFGS